LCNCFRKLIRNRFDVRLAREFGVDL